MRQLHVRLTQQPAGNVTVSIVGDGQADVVAINGVAITPAQYAVIGGIRPLDAVHRATSTRRRRRSPAPPAPSSAASTRDGFKPGQLIQVQGFTATYTVLTVADTAMTVAVAVAGTQFGSQTLTNVKINVLQRVGTLHRHRHLRRGADNAITRSDGSNWIADGFLEGQRIRIAGGPNAGDYKIALIDGPAGSYATVMHLTLEHAIVAAAAGTVTVVADGRRS